MTRTTTIIVMLIALLGLVLCSQLAKADNLQGFKDLAIKYKDCPNFVSFYPTYKLIYFYAKGVKKGDREIAVAVMSYKNEALAFYEIINGKSVRVWVAEPPEEGGADETGKVPVE